MHPIYERRPRRAKHPWLKRRRGSRHAILDRPITAGERLFTVVTVSAMVVTTLAYFVA